MEETMTGFYINFWVNCSFKALWSEKTFKCCCWFFPVGTWDLQGSSRADRTSTTTTPIYDCYLRCSDWVLQLFPLLHLGQLTTICIFIQFYSILTDLTVDFIVLYSVSLFEMSFVNKVFLYLYPQEEDNELNLSDNCWATFLKLTFSQIKVCECVFCWRVLHTCKSGL